MADDEEPTTPAARAAHHAHVDAEQVHSRAVLLPEEEAVGSEDPEGQARVILEDSAERTEDQDASPTTFLEHRTSEQTL